ncbi:ABC transporter substrate-binding protein [Bosea sp. UNC402CLCol]|uniref:ABC transporter substrate-binding protein n=1 Tax=unclassified Bosea (in: a-proteobacteria) TaxID=2653178 RepID=UPI00068C2086|nr:ABC transporter substrate-binding protein [Bosea sp. UNC402CLCol]
MMTQTRRKFVMAAAFGALLAAGPAFAQAPSGKLVLYTSQPEKDAAQTIAAFKKAYPSVDVDIFRSGTTEVMGKLAAEISAGQPGADVLLIADAASMEILKAQKQLLAYPAAKTDGLQPGSFDADKTYFGSKLITTGIAYNTAAKEKPSSWTDLDKPGYKGQISMPSPLYSGAAAIMLSTMTARADLGWKLFEGLKANEAVAVRGNGAVLRSVATGEKAYGVLVDFMAYNAKKQGSPIDFVFPKEGAPAVTEPVAIVKTTKNEAAAKAFVDFILSDDGQKLALAMGYIPAKPSVGAPSWLPEGTKINVMPSDIAAVVKVTEADKARFATMFGN